MLISSLKRFKNGNICVYYFTRFSTSASKCWIILSFFTKCTRIFPCTFQYLLLRVHGNFHVPFTFVTKGSQNFHAPFTSFDKGTLKFSSIFHHLLLKVRGNFRALFIILWLKISIYLSPSFAKGTQKFPCTF